MNLANFCRNCLSRWKPPDMIKPGEGVLTFELLKFIANCRQCYLCTSIDFIDRTNSDQRWTQDKMKIKIVSYSTEQDIRTVCPVLIHL